MPYWTPTPRLVCKLVTTLLAAPVICANLAAAIEVNQEPLQAPPEVGVARMVGNSLEIATFHPRTIVRTADSRFPAGVTWKMQRGTVQPHPTPEVTTVTETVISTFSLQHIEARRIDGAAIAPDMLAVELKSNKPILFSRSPNPVPAIYRSMFDPQTIVIVVGRPAVPTGVPMTVAPVR